MTGDNSDVSSLDKNKIGFLGNFPPKECGIATFTKDIVDSMNKKWNPRLKSRVIALNEENAIYNYGKDVTLQFNKDDLEEYISIAKHINQRDDLKLICIQHEFGIFGGAYGNYIIPFLETIEKPVVITFHSVLPNPDEVRKRIVKFICDKSAGVIVMAKKAIDILEQDYGVDREKVHLVYHGVPNVQFKSQDKFKEKLNLKGKTVLSTFGLLSKGKGIEYMIRSLPEIVKKHPDVVYLIIGETHPVVRRREGEEYRNSLMEEVEELGLKNHVKFYNKYLTLQEIIHYLLATDVYVCTNLEKNQITSGTLSYAMACGRAVVSTAIAYAEELLANDRGVVAKQFKNPRSYSKAIEKLLSDEKYKKAVEKNAYAFGRQMTWNNVAARYLRIFNNIVKLREETVEKFPAVKLNHLQKMTDKFGVIQFSKNARPDKSSGYTVDDNSRALIASVLHRELFDSPISHNLSHIYLDFLKIAQDKNGDFNRDVNGIVSHSQDAFGRSIWALGYTIYKTSDKELREKAEKLFDFSFKKISGIKSLRAKAFTIGGLYYHYKKFQDKTVLAKIRKFANSLVDCYQGESCKKWKWFEDKLTYSNSKIPESLFLAYDLTKNKKYLEVAEKTLKFLSNITFIDGKLAPIGQNGWCVRNGERAFFDQQPVDAASMVQTYLIAYKVTGKKDYYKKAVLAFNWFLGKNYLGQMVYEENTGGCYDGLSKRDINLNQGAESTICYLMSRLFLEEVKRNKK